MASYHCTVKVGGKGKAGAHAAYISREGKYSGSERYEDLEATAYGNMPEWSAHNPAHFWTAADEYERVNGATYREIEVALPRELTPEQRRELVEDFIGQEIGDKHAYQWAIHTPDAALEKGEQPHAHIMYSERTIDGIDRDPEQYFKRYNSKTPEKGGCRKDSAGTEERLQATRQRWANVQNRHLERHGIEARVDHRSLKEQGIDREPEKHIGASRVMGMPEQDVAALLTRRAAEGELDRAQHDVSSVIDLSGDLKAAVAERDHQQLKIKQGQENEQRINRSLERIGGNVRAAARTRQDASGALLASKQHIVATTGHTRDIVRGTQGAIQGVERRISERDYGRVVAAAKRQFERADNLLQQAVGHFDDVIQPIAAAAKHVEIYTVERERQAKERVQAARKAIEATNLPSARQSAPVASSARVNRYAGLSAKEMVAAMDADAAKAKILSDNQARHRAAVAGIEKTVAASDLTPGQRAIVMARVRENAAKSVPKAGAVAVDAPQEKRTRLAGEDVTLFKGAERALAAGDMKALASHLRKIDQVETTLSSAATPNRWDTKKFDEDQEARQLAGRDFNRRREAINAEAKERGEKKIPFAVQGTFTSATYDHYQEEATKALGWHLETKRPLGFFSRETKDTKAWDTRAADLEKYKAVWDKAIAWRDGKEAAAKTVDGTTFYSRLDAIRNEHEAKSTGAIAKCASFKGRLQDFAQERERIERATGELSPQDKKQLTLEIERGQDRGMGR